MMDLGPVLSVQDKQLEETIRKKDKSKTLCRVAAPSKPRHEYDELDEKVDES